MGGFKSLVVTQGIAIRIVSYKMNKVNILEKSTIFHEHNWYKWKKKIRKAFKQVLFSDE